MATLADEILDTLPALLFGIDDSGQVIEYRASPFIKGHPQPPQLPCSLFDLWPQTTAAEITRAITRLKHGQAPLQFSYSVDEEANEHGRERHFKARISKQNGRFIIIAMDASEELSQEGEKQRLYEQLRQTQKMEALGQLTGGIAHDFNNILASILGYADLTLDAVEVMGEEDLARYLREVIDSGEKARDLIAQMLAFSRAKPNDAVALMPAPLIKEAVKMLHSALPTTITLNVNSEEHLPLIKIDPAQLNQIIINLCINARDAIGEDGAINITVAASQYQQLRCNSCQDHFEGEYVEIAISDNGSGIDPLLLGRIFDPFFTTKEFNRNSGMGLSVVHGIIHDQGGHIVVDSQPGHGTTVRLFFPAIPTATATTHPKSPPKTLGIKATILVIDDEESTARLQGELLRNKGFAVEVFSDAFQALQSYRLDPARFDLALVDQIMPGMNGIAVAQELLELRPEMPIILNTTEEGRDDSNAAKAAGIRALLTKPIHSARLLNTIIELLQPQK
jgi:signal transduction histidine kinase